MSVINNIIVSVVQVLPKSVVGFFSRKYIAGESLDSAVSLVKELNKKVVIVARESGYSDAKKDVAVFTTRMTLATVLRWVESLPFVPQSIEVRSEG